MTNEQVSTVERIIRDLEAASSRNDVEGPAALFAEDATIESYLVSRVFRRAEGVCRGRGEIRELALALSQHEKPWGRHGPPIIHGNTIVMEYSSASSDAEKFSVDLLEVKDGKIQSLRAYAGWRAMMAFPGGTPDPVLTGQTREDQKRKVTMLFEAFNRGELGVVDELVGAEFAGPQGQNGPAGFKAVVVGLRVAFPDIRYTLDDVVVEGDRVAARWHWVGTHKAPFRDFPANGRTISHTASGIFRFKAGKIVAATLEMDRLGFLEQLGAVPTGIANGPRPYAPVSS